MGKIAFVFAGQGAQYPGMGKDLHGLTPAADAVFALLGEELQKTVFDGPAEELNLTQNAQPALFVTDLACALLLREGGIEPDAVAGFSLGEIPATAFAGLMTIPDAYRFVLARADAMARAAKRYPGTMLAVLKLDAEKIETICARFGMAYPVNYNCPGQTVVACAEEVAGELDKALVAAGGRVMKLKVSGAFHSRFMSQASEDIRAFLADIKFAEPRMPIYSNVTAQPYVGDANQMRELLARQVCSPVLWQKTIENMISEGFDTFVEVGPGRVLSGLIKKISPDTMVYAVSDRTSLQAVLGEIKR